MPARSDTANTGVEKPYKLVPRKPGRSSKFMMQINTLFEQA